jgi:acyl carrier protein
MAIELQDTSDKVVAIIVEKLDIDPSLVHMTSTLQDLGADSLDLVEIIMKIEEEFGIEINDEVVEKLQNMQDLINYVHELRVGKK